MSSPWTGSAAVCIDGNKLLMVLQGKPEEEKTWSVPSGGRLPGETYEECCQREAFEETGYRVEVDQEIMIKNGAVHYFRVHLAGGRPVIQDPDRLIYDIAWKSIDDLRDLSLTYEEDRLFLEALLKNHANETVT